MRVVRKVLFLSLVFACCSCAKPPAATSTEESVQITGVHLFADAGGKPGQEVQKFDYRQKTLYFGANLNRMVKEKPGNWLFSAKHTSVGDNQPIQSLQGKFDGNAMSAQIQLGGRPWPVGVYHVDVNLDGKPIGGFDYEVTGQTEKIAFLSHAIAPDDGKGVPGKPVTSFKPTDHTMHIQVATKGIDTTEPEVVWRLFHVVGGKDTELANTTQPPMTLQDSVFKCQFTSPKDWEKGDYRADIFMNGKKVHSVPFKVQ